MAREQVKRKKASEAAAIPRGVLVRDGALVSSDPWIVVEDDAALSPTGDVVVSVTRFKAEREALQARAGRVGLLVKPNEAVEGVGSDAGRFALIMVQFPIFRDGRGYTAAQLLRERYGYRGELRATGDVLEDQLFFMMRCGFDAFEIVGTDPLAAYERAMRTFSFTYQPSGDAFVPAHRLRAQRHLGKAAE